MKKSIFLLAIFLFLFQQCNSQPATPEPEETGTWASAAEINARLGKGINIGNTLEAMLSWQSPFDPADMKRIADLGFTHVRLPIRWERDDRSMSSAPYAIRPDFMKTIQSVVIDKNHSTYNLVFTSAYTDPQARIVFSMGNAGNTPVVLSDIQLMEVKF